MRELKRNNDWSVSETKSEFDVQGIRFTIVAYMFGLYEFIYFPIKNKRSNQSISLKHYCVVYFDRKKNWIETQID